MQTHVFSFCLMLPFFAVSLALFLRNRYPAQVFVGDTYCYFAGMTFAVVGILGHFSKTLLLFFIPQIFNFLYSCPQLFRCVPCPRHRLPRFDPKDGLLHVSMAQLYETAEAEKTASMRVRLGALFLRLCHSLGLVHMSSDPTVYKKKRKSSNQDHTSVQAVFTWSGTTWTHCSNMTLINLALVWCGPLHEQTTCLVLMLLQFLFGFCLSFSIRYGLVRLVFW